MPICVDGCSVDCGFTGVRSGFGEGIWEGEFYGEFDVWIQGVELLLKLVDLIFPGSTVDIIHI